MNHKGAVKEIVVIAAPIRDYSRQVVAALFHPSPFFNNHVTLSY
jgi:hypothetical protein